MNRATVTLWTWLAFLVAGIASAGSLWLSLGMDLQACPLCFYQRTYALGVFGLLLVGLVSRVAPGPILSLLTLPCAVGGLGVAGYHVSLELRGLLECPQGMFNLGTAPQQSLAVFVLLLLVLVRDISGHCCIPAGQPKPGPTGVLIGSVLGVVFAGLCILSAPKPVTPPLEAYSKPPVGCRPVKKMSE